MPIVFKRLFVVFSIIGLGISISACAAEKVKPQTTASAPSAAPQVTDIVTEDKMLSFQLPDKWSKETVQGQEVARIKASDLQAIITITSYPYANVTNGQQWADNAVANQPKYRLTVEEEYQVLGEKIAVWKGQPRSEDNPKVITFTVPVFVGGGVEEITIATSQKDKAVAKKIFYKFLDSIKNLSPQSQTQNANQDNSSDTGNN